MLLPELSQILLTATDVMESLTSLLLDAPHCGRHARDRACDAAARAACCREEPMIPVHIDGAHKVSVGA